MTSGFDETMRILAGQAHRVRMTRLTSAIGDLELTELERRMLHRFAYQASGDDVDQLVTLLTRLRG